MNDAMKQEPEGPVLEGDLQARRDFLAGLGKWSSAVIGGVALAGVLGQPNRADASGWVNRRGGWVNGGGRWVNRGGGWLNRGNTRGGWTNRGAGGSWTNRRGASGGDWANHR